MQQDFAKVREIDIGVRLYFFTGYPKIWPKNQRPKAAGPATC